MNSWIRRVVVLVASLSMAACQSSEPTVNDAGAINADHDGGFVSVNDADTMAVSDAGTSSEDAALGADAGVATLSWDEMGPAERRAFMAGTVMPRMKELFMEANAERFASFSCATCHGANARDVGFRMPNGIAPLDPAAIGPLLGSGHPMAAFMNDVVTPTMAEMLGRERFNPTTREGFGCFGCHGRAAAD